MSRVCSNAASEDATDDNDELLAGQHSTDSSIFKTILIFVVFHTVYFVAPVSFALGPLFIALFVPQYRSVSLALIAAYMLHINVHQPNKHHGSPWKLMENNPIIRLVVEWLPVRIMRTKRLDPSKLYVFACHPHGTLAFNRAAVGFSTETLWDVAFPGIKFRVLVASAAFLVPVIREMWLWSYCVDASKKVAVKVMRELRSSIFVYPGGEKEQVQTVYGKHRIVLRDRKGFVKLAMQEGAELVPVYAFGETDLYHHSLYALDFRTMLVKRFGVAIPLLMGQYGLMPFRKPVTMVFGSPMRLKQRAEPTQEEIDAAHSAYCEALQGLFDAYKVKFGYADAELVIL